MESKTITSDKLLEYANRMHDENYRLVQMCATRIGDRIVLDYSFGRGYEFVNLKSEIEADTEISSISRVFPSAFLYENEMHEKNQRRIRIGLRCIWLIPLVFLCLLFWTDSSKVVFLILWIASLFGIAIYLILVEYSDYKLQKKLGEISGQKDKEVQALLAPNLTGMEDKIRNVIEKIDSGLNAPEELETKEDSEVKNVLIEENEIGAEVKEIEEHI